jgi:hypothetical protein
MISRNPTAARYQFTNTLAVIQPHLQRRGTLSAMATEMTTARAALAVREADTDAIKVALLKANLNALLRR